MEVEQPVAPPATFITRNGVYVTQSAAGQILPADPTRLVLLLATTNSSQAVPVYFGGSAGSFFGWMLTTGTVYEFTYQKHGPIVWQSVWNSGIISIVSITWQTLSTQ